jgi:hypothetical protein
MNSRDMLREASSLSTKLFESGFASDFNTSKLVQTGEGRTLVTWSTADDSSISMEGSEATIPEYWRLLGDRQYSVLLLDGGLLQHSWIFDANRLLTHRFVYIPCPVLLDSLTDVAAAQRGGEVISTDLNLELGKIGYDLRDYVEEVLFDELQYEVQIPSKVTSNTSEYDLPLLHQRRLRLRATLRFDYDIEKACVGHSGSHLHFCGENSRWPVFGPLSLGHFVQFIFRHHYPDLWWQHQLIRDWPKPFGDRCITQPEEFELFVECRQSI